MITYLLDANVFISAKNLHYGFDFVKLDQETNSTLKELGYGG